MTEIVDKIQPFKSKEENFIDLLREGYTSEEITGAYQEYEKIAIQKAKAAEEEEKPESSTGKILGLIFLGVAAIRLFKYLNYDNAPITIFLACTALVLGISFLYKKS
jgi:hypothetical protein